VSVRRKRKASRVLSAVAILAAAFAPVANAAAASSCIQTSRIAVTKFEDPKTVIFLMTNGTVYRNALRRSCTIDRFDVFAWRTVLGHLCPGDSVLSTKGGDTCVVGDFEKISP
jgi:hypothetical protein